MFELKGVLDSVQVCELYSQKETLFKNSTLDLKDLTKLSSSGVAFLVIWAKSCESKKLKILNASDEVKRNINIFGVSQLFDFE